VYPIGFTDAPGREAVSAAAKEIAALEAAIDAEAGAPQPTVASEAPAREPPEPAGGRLGSARGAPCGRGDDAGTEPPMRPSVCLSASDGRGIGGGTSTAARGDLDRVLSASGVDLHVSDADDEDMFSDGSWQSGEVSGAKVSGSDAQADEGEVRVCLSVCLDPSPSARIGCFAWCTPGVVGGTGVSLPVILCLERYCLGPAGHDLSAWDSPVASFVTETNRIHLILFDTQNRTLDPSLATFNRILIPVMVVLQVLSGSYSPGQSGQHMSTCSGTAASLPMATGAF
jgi:hypothetical protein